MAEEILPLLIALVACALCVVLLQVRGQVQ
jgi:hypothetical protein